MKIIKINSFFAVKIPSIPNFLIDVKGNSISIKDVSEDGLRKIGERWIEELIKKSKT